MTMGKKRRRPKDLLAEIRCGTDAAKIGQYLDDMRCDVNQRCKKSGATPLMIASEKAKNRVVEVLLQHKACLEYRDSFGDTAFHYLCRPNQHKWSKKVKILLQLLNVSNSATAIMTPNERGTSAISGLYSVARLGKNMATNDRERDRAMTVESLLKRLDPKEGGSLPSYESAQQEYWSQKLSMAAEDDTMDNIGRVGAEPADIFDDSFYAPDVATDIRESDEAYCRRIAREMQAKRQRQHMGTDNGSNADPTDAPQRPPWLNRDGLSEKMKEKERQHQEESARILKKEVAETRRLQASARAAVYQSAAKAFFTTMAQRVRSHQAFMKKQSASTEPRPSIPDSEPHATGVLASDSSDKHWRLSFSDIPWPGETIDDVRVVMSHGLSAHDIKARQKHVREEQRRWHPDRWSSTVELFVAEEHRCKVSKFVQLLTTTSIVFVFPPIMEFLNASLHVIHGRSTDAWWLYMRLLFMWVRIFALGMFRFADSHCAMYAYVSIPLCQWCSVQFYPWNVTVNTPVGKQLHRCFAYA